MSVTQYPRYFALSFFEVVLLDLDVVEAASFSTGDWVCDSWVAGATSSSASAASAFFVATTCVVIFCCTGL